MNFPNVQYENGNFPNVQYSQLKLSNYSILHVILFSMSITN